LDEVFFFLAIHVGPTIAGRHYFQPAPHGHRFGRVFARRPGRELFVEVRVVRAGLYLERDRFPFDEDEAVPPVDARLQRNTTA
jgi:hypothetical protein